jgi:hypothetical protein
MHSILNNNYNNYLLNINTGCDAFYRLGVFDPMDNIRYTIESIIQFYVSFNKSLKLFSFCNTN